MGAFIKGISYYLPGDELTNADLATNFPEWSAEKVTGKIGITTRHVSKSEETSGDLGQKAAEALFAEHEIQPSDIDFIMLCTQSPDYFLPTTACLLQDRLGVPKYAGAMDFNLGCSGYVYGLALAKGLVCSGIARNVLLITAETYSKFIHKKDKSNLAIFGDAAAATLVSDSGYAEILNFCLGTDGSGFDKLIVRTGALRNRDSLNDLRYDESSNPVSSDHLFMDGSEIFNFTLEMVPGLVEATLIKNGISMEQIDLYVFHQANKFMMNFLRQKIKIPENKFFYFLEKVGNTVSSTIPIALYEAMKTKEIKAGNKVLLAGFGVGYSWGGTVLSF